jgi:hypothetical protein
MERALPPAAAPAPRPARTRAAAAAATYARTHCGPSPARSHPLAPPPPRRAASLKRARSSWAMPTRAAWRWSSGRSRTGRWPTCPSARRSSGAQGREGAGSAWGPTPAPGPAGSGRCCPPLGPPRMWAAGRPSPTRLDAHHLPSPRPSAPPLCPPNRPLQVPRVLCGRCHDRQPPRHHPPRRLGLQPERRVSHRRGGTGRAPWRPSQRRGRLRRRGGARLQLRGGRRPPKAARSTCSLLGLTQARPKP